MLKHAIIVSAQRITKMRLNAIIPVYLAMIKTIIILSVTNNATL